LRTERNTQVIKVYSRKVSECDMVVFNDNKEILSSIDAVKKVCWCLDLTFAKLTAGSVIEKYTQGLSSP